MVKHVTLDMPDASSAPEDRRRVAAVVVLLCLGLLGTCGVLLAPHAQHVVTHRWHAKALTDARAVWPGTFGAQAVANLTEFRGRCGI